MTQSDIINNNFSKAFECIKCSNAYDTGEVLSEEKLFKQISERKHSTFDLSKFTVVGSPTITDDGVASGFSNTSYLSLPNNVILGTDFEIYLSFVCLIDSTYTQICRGTNGGRFAFQLIQQTGTIKFNFRDANIELGAKTLLSEIQIGKRYITKIKLKNGVLSWGYYLDNIYTEVESISTLLDMDTIDSFKIGGGVDNSFAGSIDLKQFSITVDGKEVFSGNKTGIDVINDIEIPYTLSKTGSKIVDVAYRDRVIDLYEQEGQAKYYTIDEDNKNFTLPMGEIYGMIGGSSSTGG